MKKVLALSCASLLLFFGGLWLSVLLPGIYGMTVCLLLFFVVNPLFFIAEGILVGVSRKLHWWLPLMSACLYLLACWIILEPGESAFLLYTVFYLIIAWISMAVAFLVRKKPNRE